MIEKLKALFLLIILSVIPAAVGEDAPAAPLPVSAVGHQSVLTLTQEREWGERIMREIRAQNQVSKDEILNTYLQGLAERVARAAPKSPFPLKVFAIPSPELNAFTFFGGHVGVYYGLLFGVGSEPELLAVLAHEYAHITQRHLARTMENHRRMMPVTLAEIVGAILVGAVTSPEAGAYATQAILDMHFQKMMAFSRLHEQEADREAIHTLGRLKSDPSALLRLFARFSKGSLFHDKVPEYLQSHPLNESRIADAENRITQLGHQPDTVRVPSDFDWMVARVLAASVPGSKQNIMSQFKAHLKQASQGSPIWRQAQYAMALCLQADREYADAAEILIRLSKTYPDAWVVAVSLAEVLYLQGKTQDSLNQFAQLVEQHPNSFPIGMAYSEYLIRDKKPALAKKCLDRFVDKYSDSLTLQQHLTQVYRLLGDLSAVHQAQAEWHLLRGNTKAAKLQLELAVEQLNTNKDLIEMAKIEAIQDRVRACEKMH